MRCGKLNDTPLSKEAKRRFLPIFLDIQRPRILFSIDIHLGHCHMTASPSNLLKAFLLLIAAISAERLLATDNTLSPQHGAVSITLQFDICGPETGSTVLTGITLVQTDSCGRATARPRFVPVVSAEGGITLLPGETFTIKTKEMADLQGLIAVNVHTAGKAFYTPLRINATTLSPDTTIIYTIKPANIPQANCWMTNLPDSVPVAALSVPGAHNAASGTVRGIGKCQQLTLQELLEAGVRCFDLRPTLNRRKTSGSYQATGLGTIHHGWADTRTSLAEAFTTFNAFLEGHPGEMLIILMRNETGDRYLKGPALDNAFVDFMADFIRQQPHIAPLRSRMTLGDCRGRIILLNRTKGHQGATAAYISWNHSSTGAADRRISWTPTDFSPACVQDCYSPKRAGNKCTSRSFTLLKPSIVEDFMDKAAAQWHAGNQETWTINHASGYVNFRNYAKNAANTNPSVRRYLVGEAPHLTKKHLRQPGPVGIIMMDFAGVRTTTYMGKTYQVEGDLLTQSIIDNNFR